MSGIWVDRALCGEGLYFSGTMIVLPGPVLKGPTPQFLFLPRYGRRRAMSRTNEQAISRRYRRVGGRDLDAHKYGLKAWPIRIRGKRRKKK